MQSGAGGRVVPVSLQGTGSSSRQGVPSTGADAPVGAAGELDGNECLAAVSEPEPVGQSEGSSELGKGGPLAMAPGLAPIRRDGAREIDQLADLLSINLAAVDQAIQHYLDQVDGLGGMLSDLLTGDGATPWLMGAAVLSGCMVARRVSRGGRDEPRVCVGGDGTTSSWYPDLTSNAL